MLSMRTPIDLNTTQRALAEQTTSWVEARFTKGSSAIEQYSDLPAPGDVREVTFNWGWGGQGGIENRRRIRRVVPATRTPSGSVDFCCAKNAASTVHKVHR